MLTLSKIRNERGFTLIETMATLVIIGLIGSVVTLFMVNATSDRERIEQTLELQEETNQLVSLIGRDFLKTSGDTFSYEFSPKNVSVTSITETRIGRSYDTSGTIAGLPTDGTLSLDITTTHKESGESMTVSSSWSRPVQENLSIRLKPKPKP